MNEWSEGNFEVWSHDGKRSVMGLVSGPFGIHFDENRDSPGWVVAHTGTGMSVAGWQPFKSVDIAKEFVARIRPLADWNDVDPEPPPDVILEINEIADELNCGDPLAELMQVPTYIGDDAFQVFLGKHGCRTNVEVIRMRFLGAAVSPGRKADIYPLVEDFFEYDMPELDGQELVGFLQTFLGLFHEVREASRHSPVTLSPVGAVVSHEGIRDILYRRIDEVVFGFLEGVWKGDNELPLSDPQAAMLTAIEEAARTYDVRFVEIVRSEEAAATEPVTDLLPEITEIDKSIETTITTLLEAFRNDRSTDHPMVKRAKALIDELGFSEGLPRDAIRQCVARRDEMVPIFLSILRDHAEGRHAIDDRENALFLIIHILGELEEQQTFPLLMDLLAGESERIEEVLGEAVTENLSQILISVFDGDTDRLYRLMNNPDVDEYVRAAVFDAWTYYVAAGRIDRAEAERYLSSGLKTLQPREEHLIWVAWVEAIAHLGFASLEGKVRNAFDIGRIPPMTILFREFEEIVEAASRTGDLAAFVGKERLAPFSDTIGVLSEWYGFSEEYLRKKEKAEQEPALPMQPTHTVTNPLRNVGRNDPCPCGSGKKFKKCCLH